MRRVGTPAEKEEPFRGHDTDIQDNCGSVTTAAPAEQPDETKGAEETPRESRKKKA